MLALTDRLRTSSRLAAMILVLLIPCLIANVGFAQQAGGQIAFSAMERDGVAIVEPALRAMAAAVAGTDVDVDAIDQAVAARPELGLADAATQVDQAAAQVVSGDPASKAALMTALAGLIVAVGDNSNLILDPDLDSFYVMDIQIVQLPKVLVAAAQAQVAVGGTATAQTVADRAVLAGTLATGAQALLSDMSTATRRTEMRTLAARLNEVETVAEAVGALHSTLAGSLSGTSAVDVTEVGIAAGEAVKPLVDALTELLTTRIDGLSGERTLTLVVVLGFVAVAIWIATAVWWRSRTSVALAVAGVTAIASGDLDVRSLPVGRDELGDIGRAVEVARLRLVEQNDELDAAQAAQVAQLKESFELQRQAEQQVRQRAQAIIGETAGVVVDELRDVVDQVSQVREAAGTIDVKVGVADEVTKRVVSQADEAGRVVVALGESLRKVVGMAQLIGQIADQTKLLALNATIEAQRAGEAGRGFNVVAEEVKELAVTTAKSTDEIAGTVHSLEADAAAMAVAISSMVEGIGGVDETSAVLRQVAKEQHDLVEQLDTCVGGAIERVRAMSGLGEKLERRVSQRLQLTAPVTVVSSGRESTGEVLDISEGGLRLRVDDGPVPTGGSITMAVRLPSGPLELKGEIVRQFANVVASRFVDLPASSLTMIRALYPRQT